MRKFLCGVLTILLIFGTVGCSNNSLEIEGVSKEFSKDVVPYFNKLEESYNSNNPSMIDEKFSENFTKIYDKYKDSELLKEQNIITCIAMLEVLARNYTDNISEFKKEYESQREFLFLVIETTDIYE